MRRGALVTASGRSAARVPTRSAQQPPSIDPSHHSSLIAPSSPESGRVCFLSVCVVRIDSWAPASCATRTISSS